MRIQLRIPQPHQSKRNPPNLIIPLVKEKNPPVKGINLLGREMDPLNKETDLPIKKQNLLIKKQNLPIKKQNLPIKK